MAAKIPRGATLIGPFAPDSKPVRTGLYLRVSDDTRQKVWAWFNASTRRWGLFADTPERAIERKSKVSKKELPWFGTAAPGKQAPSFRPVSIR